MNPVTLIGARRRNMRLRIAKLTAEAPADKKSEPCRGCGQTPCRELAFDDPYSGNTKDNTVLARRLCRAACDAGQAPFAPHLHYTQFLNDATESERKVGIACGLVWLGQADEVWVFAEDYDHCSDGMKAEIDVALKCSLPPDVVYMPKEFQAIEAPLRQPPQMLSMPSPELGLEVE